MLPVIKLRDHEISRLIIGGNPFSGNSHMNWEKSNEMANYYTTEVIKKTLFRCEECGINTMVLRADEHIFRIIREYRNEGGCLKWIAQTAPEMLSFEGNINKILRFDPVAIFHHGTVTDELFKSGNYEELQKRLKIIRNTGKQVGLCTHMPSVVEYAEKHHWDLDFYMTCIYNLSKIDRVSSGITGKMILNEPFDDEDRSIMYKTIRNTDKPCLVFKILGAGRRCETPETVREAYSEAFSNIKPIDAVVVGMFQKYRDQVYENANIVGNILKNR